MQYDDEIFVGVGAAVAVHSLTCFIDYVVYMHIYFLGKSVTFLACAGGWERFVIYENCQTTNLDWETDKYKRQRVWKRCGSGVSFTRKKGKRHNVHVESRKNAFIKRKKQ